MVKKYVFSMLMVIGMLYISPAMAAMKIDDFVKLCEHGTLRQIQNAMQSVRDINARDKNGGTALMAAAGGNADPNVTEALINAGAKVDLYGTTLNATALMFASALNHNPDVLTVLIRHGANVHARGHGGNTPLMLAAMFDTTPKIIKTLIQNGARITIEMTMDEQSY